jgi:hypothetical protein
MNKTANPIALAKRALAQVTDPEQGFALLNYFMVRAWPEAAWSVTRVLQHAWRGTLPADLLRTMLATLRNPVDILDFTEALLRGLGQGRAADKVVAIMQGIIEEPDNLRFAWGPTLEELKTK